MQAVVKAIIRIIENAPRDRQKDLVFALQEFRDGYPRSYKNTKALVPWVAELIRSIEAVEWRIAEEEAEN